MTHTHRASLKNRQHADFRQRQKGMSMITMGIVVLVALFFVTAAFKVGPSYAEYWTISKIAENTAADTELLRSPKSKVYQSIQRGFTQNNLWDAKAEDHIKLARDAKKGMSVVIDYESRAKLFGNIYVVTSFQKEAN